MFLSEDDGDGSVEVLLSQIDWMWGAEMGANECGVVIGPSDGSPETLRRFRVVLIKHMTRVFARPRSRDHVMNWLMLGMLEREVWSCVLNSSGAFDLLTDFKKNLIFDGHIASCSMFSQLDLHFG